MNFKKLTREIFMLCLFQVSFAITPGFGKLNLDDYNEYENGGWNKLSNKILNFKNGNNGFELNCAVSPAKDEDVYVEENGGVLSRVIVE